MVLFFGDSLASAENNNFNGFVEKLDLKEYKNYGVSGTTISDYSLYPVGSTDLISLLFLHKDEVRTAEKIFLCYGCNDITSVTTGYITLNHAIISFVKAADLIRQLNMNVKIYFISLGVNIDLIAAGQCRYINSIYLKDTEIRIHRCNWIENYKKFELNISKYVDKVIPIDIRLEEYLDKDEIHPNDTGYKLIADIIKNHLGEI